MSALTSGFCRSIKPQFFEGLSTHFFTSAVTSNFHRPCCIGDEVDVAESMDGWVAHTTVVSFHADCTAYPSIVKPAPIWSTVSRLSVALRIGVPGASEERSKLRSVRPV